MTQFDAYLSDYRRSYINYDLYIQFLNQLISLSIRKYFFFSIWASFLRYWQFTVQQVRKDDHIFFFFTTSNHSKIFRHLHSFFISIKLVSILKLRCLKNKHILRIFFSLRIFRYLFLCSQVKQKVLIWF